MKKILLFIAVFCGIAGLKAQTAFNDANAEPRALGSFSSLKVSHAFDVYLVQADKEGVAVSSSDGKFNSQIKTEVKDGVLRIWHDGGNIRNWNTGKMKLKAYVSFKSLNRLDISGACDVYITNTWKDDNVKIDMSGASNLQGKLDMSKLMVDLSGASDMKITGSSGQVDIDASGASNFKGYDLSVDFCNAEVSGASDIQITVNKEISASASGASDIRYKGKGVVRNVKTSGASSISRRDG